MLLAIPALIAWRYFRGAGSKPSLLFSSTDSFSNGSTWRVLLSYLIPILRTLAYGSFVIALARPQTSVKEEEVKAEGIDIVIAMDVSTSMLAEDFQPNRIEVSKALAVEFVDKRKYDRIGLVVFGGESFTQCPVTTDHMIVKSFLSRLHCGMLEDGTAIGMGLSSAVNRLKESEFKSKIIILLTDGVNNRGYIDPSTAANIATEFGIKVYTIGIGTSGMTRMPTGFGNGSFAFRTVRGELDEKLLREIAGQTGGKYYRAQSSEALKQIYDDIDKLEKTEIEINVLTRYFEEYYRFLKWGLIFLVLEIILKRTILRVFP